MTATSGEHPITAQEVRDSIKELEAWEAKRRRFRSRWFQTKGWVVSFHLPIKVYRKWPGWPKAAWEQWFDLEQIEEGE